MSLNKLEKGVNAKVIEFADNTKLFATEKIWFRELQEKVMKQSESWNGNAIPKRKSDADVKGNKQSELHRKKVYSALDTASQKRHLWILWTWA